MSLNAREDDPYIFSLFRPATPWSSVVLSSRQRCSSDIKTLLLVLGVAYPSVASMRLLKIWRYACRTEYVRGGTKLHDMEPERERAILARVLREPPRPVDRVPGLLVV